MCCLSFYFFQDALERQQYMAMSAATIIDVLIFPVSTDCVRRVALSMLDMLYNDRA